MSLTFGFYNSKNGDRKYNARQLAQVFDGLITDGVFMSIGEAFKVEAQSGFTVVVGTGRAWFNHTWTYNDTKYPVTVDQPDVILNRIDTLVLEVNENISVRENFIKMVSGTPATVPVKPTLTNDEFVHQYPLAHISVAPNATEITQSNIEYAVGSSECPFVTGLMQGMDIDNIVAQWESQFKDWSKEMDEEFAKWFENLQTQLSGDVAANLQMQLDNKADRSGDTFTGDVVFKDNFGIFFGEESASDPVRFRLVTDSDAGGFYIQMYKNGVWQKNSIYVNAEGTPTAGASPSSAWGLRSICVTDSSGAAVTGNTAAIFMQRK